MKKNSAFTLLEMIFVIIVLGIVAGGAFIQISSIYEQLLQKQGSSELENESKIIIEEITARISSAIKGSIVVTDSLDTNDNCRIISEKLSDKDNVLIWMAKSDESNTGLWDEGVGDYRGWSGFVDVSESNESIIYTRGSRIDFADKVIADLTGGGLDDKAAIYFFRDGNETREDIGVLQREDACKIFYGDYDTESHMYKVKKGRRNDELEPSGTKLFKLEDISERYTLSHAAYALKLESGGELYLYEFRPWNGEQPSSGKRYLLGKNVSSFGIRSDGGMFRINVCLQKQIVGDYNITVCKEKAVF